MNPDDLDLPSVQTPVEEEERERMWASFEADCIAFALSEPDGWSAVLRCVARAMKEQVEILPRG